MANPTVIVQHITVEWTKDQRGADAATRRNALPDVLPLPNQRPDPDAVMICHAVHFSGYFDFNQTFETVKSYSSIKNSVGCVCLLPHDHSVIVSYAYSWDEAGYPRREQHSFPIGTIYPGQWAKIAYNGRFSYESIWIYRYQTLSVGVFDTYTSTVFLDTEPTYRYRQIAKLK